MDHLNVGVAQAYLNQVPFKIHNLNHYLNHNLKIKVYKFKAASELTQALADLLSVGVAQPESGPFLNQQS